MSDKQLDLLKEQLAPLSPQEKLELARFLTEQAKLDQAAEQGEGAAGYDFDSIVYFYADEDLDRNVLGRHSWLDRVVLGLIDYEGKLLLSPYSL